MNDREKAIEELKKMSAENGNKVFLGVVHPLYGPLRGLNFVLENPNFEEILNTIDSTTAGLSEEAQKGLIKRVRKEGAKNFRDACIRIWDKTGLATVLMILPSELIKDAENAPTIVNTIEAGRVEILNYLMLTADMQKQDAFFYRVGKI